jgi:predicted transcriptional regulator
MGPTADESDSTLEAIEFIARSANRVVVLETLTDGPMERYELEEATGISRPTVSRILEDFRARGWITSAERRFQLTQLGAYVTDEFDAFYDRMHVVDTLGDVVEWLPEESFDFDLACLTSAEVVRPQKTDASAPTTRIVRRLETADRVQVMTYTLLPEAFRVCRDKTVDGDQELEVVFDSKTVTTLATDPRNIEQAREMLETGRVSFYASDRPIPYVLVMPDCEVVVICLTGSDGVPRAVIDTDDETVLSWAQNEFQTFQSEATPLELSLFAG